MIKQFKFLVKKYADEIHLERNARIWLCFSGVRKYFDVPETAKILFISLSDNKPRHRQYLKLEFNNDDPFSPELISPGDEYIIEPVRSLVARQNFDSTKPIFAWVEYE